MTDRPNHQLPSVPAELVTAGCHNHLIVFVGAGASTGAGYPAWPDLIQQLHRKSVDSGDADPKVTSVQAEEWFVNKYDDLPEKAQFLLTYMGRAKLMTYLADILDRPQVEPTETHRALAKIENAIFVTTNFDKLLELALEEAHGTAPTVVVPADVDAIHRISPGDVFKIHGDIRDANSIVLALEDYYRMSYKESPAWKERLKSWLQPPYELLFVGYSISDSDIQDVLNIIRSAYSDRINGPFWLQRKGKIALEVKASTLNLRTIWVAEYEHIPAWVRLLAAEIEGTLKQTPQAVQLAAYNQIATALFQTRVAEAQREFSAQNYEECMRVSQQIAADCESLIAKGESDAGVLHMLGCPPDRYNKAFSSSRHPSCPCRRGHENSAARSNAV